MFAIHVENNATTIHTIVLAEFATPKYMIYANATTIHTTVLATFAMLAIY